MKKIYSWLLFLSFLLFFMPSVLAHSSGLPFIKINNQVVHSNLFLNSKVNPKFLLGNDVAPLAKYTVNDPLTVAIDNIVLRNPYHAKATYQWNFGDKTEPSYGEQTEHTYKKPGTYFITLKVQNETNGPFLFLETVQITIVPNAEYQLPKAHIIVNNKLITDPKNANIPITVGKAVTFDARTSTGNIISYQWDFVDGSGSDTAVVSHTYKKGQFTIYFAQLRITDNQGIVSDEMLLLDSSPAYHQSLWSHLPILISSFIKHITDIFLR